METDSIVGDDIVIVMAVRVSSDDFRQRCFHFAFAPPTPTILFMVSLDGDGDGDLDGRWLDGED